ncbi:MAG TPA: ThiF family adenylyltransferase [Helicobacteraceae bacterium]|nr:ThiF family adenylyltransferase [Helicobacteraceae bacterium]
MMEYFHRQVQLWGEETQLALQDKKIAIIGSGGLGSSLAFALGASGIGEIHIVDFDEVSLHNIHRQIAFRRDDVGKFKSEIVAQVMVDRCGYVKAYAHTCDFNEFSKKEIALDLIIDATDNLPSRAEISQYAAAHHIPLVYGSVEAFHGQVCVFDEAEFTDLFKIIKKSPAGIAAPIVMHIASSQANLALRYLAGLSVKKDWLYYLSFNDEGALVTQNFSMPKRTT